MDTANLKQLKTELNELTRDELIACVARLAKFKKENKELLTYLLFEQNDEENYIQEIKSEIDENFKTINTNSYFYIKKSVRKILKITKTYIRYSNVAETEVNLLLYFCKKLRSMSPSMTKNQQLLNIYRREIISVEKKLTKLHPDLQYDYQKLLSNLKES